MMHITPSASAYLENIWLWVADHMSEYGLLPVETAYLQRLTFRPVIQIDAMMEMAW